jgi:hypothetical protein
VRLLGQTGLPKLVQTLLRKQSNMHDQFELFEHRDQDWIQRLWKRLPATSRLEVLNLLAQMGQAALRAQRVKAAAQRKESTDEP